MPNIFLGAVHTDLIKSDIDRNLRSHFIIAGCVYLFYFAFLASPLAQENTPTQLETEIFSDWQLQCLASATPLNSDEKQESDLPHAKQSAPQCELSQSVTIKDKDRLIEVINLSITRVEDKAQKVEYAMIILTPLDVHLPSAFGLRVDQKKPYSYGFRNCNQLGCWVIIPLEQALISEFKAGKEGQAAYRLLNGQPLNIRFSLIGFSNGFDALEQKYQMNMKNEVRK